MVQTSFKFLMRCRIYRSDSLFIHTLRSWVKKGKIDGATLQNNKWYVPEASINNTNEVIDNPIDTTSLKLLIKEKDERIVSLENQIKHLQEQNRNLDDARMRSDQLNLNLTIQMKSNSVGLLGKMRRLFLGDPKITSQISH